MKNFSKNDFVTDLNETIEKIREDDQFLALTIANMASIVEHSDDAIIGLDNNGLILSWNKGAENMYKYSAEDVIGEKISLLKPPEYPDDLGTILKEIDNKPLIHRSESIRRTKDDLRINVSVIVLPITDSKNVLRGISIVERDITKLKYAEDALRDSEEKYRLLFREDLTGDFIATPDGRILECNPAFAEIYGFKDSEAANGFMISQFNPNDWHSLIDDLKVDRKIQSHQTIHKRLDGNLIHVVANMVGSFDDSGDLYRIKGYVFDDTERKEAEDALRDSEEKYRLLFDEDLTGDFIATPDGRILECNPAFAEIYGFNTIESALSFNISKFNTFDWPYMITRLKKERKLSGFQSWQRRSDGLRIHVVSNLVGIFNDSLELIQVKGYVFDDTERKQAEEEIQRARKQMKEILDSIQDGFFVLDQTWVFTYINKCAGDYLGKDPDDLIGQNIWDIFPSFIGTTCEINFRKAMESHEIQHFKYPTIENNKIRLDFSVYPSSDGISVYWREI